MTIVHLQISVKGLLNRKEVRRYFAQSHIRKIGYTKKYIYKQYFQKQSAKPGSKARTQEDVN